MNFEQHFVSWLHKSLSENIAFDVQAFCFNLYEPAGERDVKFGIELIGAGSFDEEDSDWPCDEVWEPATRGISIPVAYSGLEWEQCLGKLKALVKTQLKGSSAAIAPLKESQGIGIGFVDGDLEIVWKR
jgi:hypothetical protein